MDVDMGGNHQQPIVVNIYRLLHMQELFIDSMALFY